MAASMPVGTVRKREHRYVRTLRDIRINSTRVFRDFV